MPYSSKAQQRFFHSEGAKKAGIAPSTVQEFDNTSKGSKLPEHVKPKFQAIKKKLKGSIV